MKKIVILTSAIVSFFLIVLIFKQCNNPEIINQTPTTISYRELIEKTDKYSIYRHCQYKIEKVVYDTVLNRTLSTIETPSIKKTLVADRVDLNEIFDSDDKNIDWNFTELSEDKISYLNSIGVYWDGRNRCYRKHK